MSCRQQFVADLVSPIWGISMSISDGSVKIRLRVHPNAARNEVLGFIGGVWHVRVSAPPVKGKANRELIDFLGQLLGIGKSQLAIVSGHTARDKVVAINGLSQAEILKRLSSG